MDRGLGAFVKEKLTLKSCLAFLVGGNSPEKMKWPWFAMVFNKVLAQAMYVAFFLGQYGAAVDPVLAAARLDNSEDAAAAASSTVVVVPAWVHAVSFNTQLICWAAFLFCWRGDPGDLDGATARGGLRRAYDAYFDALASGRKFNAASTWVFSKQFPRGKHPRFEFAPGEERSSKHEPHRGEIDRDTRFF